MTQKEQKQTTEFKDKWMLVFKDTTNENYPIEIYVSRHNPYTFCCPSCGAWNAWRIDPETGRRYDSCLCTFEELMWNY